MLVRKPGDKSYEELCQNAFERRGCFLTVETVYTYRQLANHLRSFGQGWTVYEPSSVVTYPVTWPSSEDEPAVERWLTARGCPDAGDLLAGPCAPFAKLLGEHACQMLENGLKPVEVAKTAHSTLVESLRAKEPEAAAAELFGGLQAFGWKTTQYQQAWDLSLEADPLYFGTEAVQTHVRKIMSGKDRKSLPLYILGYLFDVNEQSAAELKGRKNWGSAEYTVHAVSIVVDPASKSLIVVDPNGTLVQGSNIEFVSMPLERRKSKPTTSLSRFDQDKAGMNALSNPRPTWVWMKKGI